MLNAHQYKLFHNVNKPLYVQLREIIIDWIESGELEPGDIIPSERSLVDMFDISRITVRKCLASLADDGYIIRQQGKETYVAERKVTHHLGLLVGMVEELQNTKDVHVDINVIYKGFEKPTNVVKRHLNIQNDSAPMYCFYRSLIKNGSPLALNYSYVPYEIGKIVDTLDLKRARVFEYLEGIGYKLNYGEQEIRAGVCTSEESKYLNYGENLPVIVITRTTYLEDGTPILYERTIYRGDEYKYSIRLQRRL